MRSQKYLLHLALVITFVFFFAQTQLSFAQLPGMPKLYGEFKMPEVGAYVTYKVRYASNNTERITKLSVVGKEKSTQGEDLYWFEQQETDPKTGGVTIAKMLISGSPQDIKTMQRMIIKSGQDPASELPQAMIQMINKAPSEKKDALPPKMKSLGLEKMKIKDQTMDCTHMRYTTKDKGTADVWTNVKVPLFGMVKSTTPEATLEVVEYGTNAVTAIKEKPQLLEIPEQK
jgi:hypothetical protein